MTVPVNTRFKADEFEYCLKQADVKLLFVVDRYLKIDFIQMLRNVCPGVDAALPDDRLPALAHVVVLGNDMPRAAVSFEQLLARGAQAADDAGARIVSPDDVLLMQFTSGTTSYPKGVMLTYDNMHITARGRSTTWPALRCRCSLARIPVLQNRC